jgi:hypothetical protein
MGADERRWRMLPKSLQREEIRASLYRRSTRGWIREQQKDRGERKERSQTSVWWWKCLTVNVLDL